MQKDQNQTSKDENCNDRQEKCTVYDQLQLRYQISEFDTWKMENEKKIEHSINENKSIPADNTCVTGVS